MKLSRISFLILIFALMTGCGGSGGSGSSSSVGGGTPPAATADNVLSITVNGPGLNNSYLNEPCVSVTICTPGTITCQTINDILLDTGSSGLRIFKQALNVPLTQASSGSGSLAECVQYQDGTSDWGPVQMASIILGNEPAVQVRIQVIDSTFFGTIALNVCGTPDQSPSAVGYNGILGVGLFAQDCGPGCTNSTSPPPIYYSCSGSNCSPTAVALPNQLQNPIGLLPQDNNGVIVQLPGIPAGGSPSVNGSLILGIGTQSNNMPSGVTAYTADPSSGDFTTNFNSTSYTSFIDSGSNGLFFPSTSALPDCPGAYSGWFCPSSTVSLSATNTGASGSPSGAVSFQIGNFDSLLTNSSNSVFDDIGGNFPDGFDWGLPFFFGRSVFVGIEGKGSSLGSGPYWAY
jgi:hypothetical protein